MSPRANATETDSADPVDIVVLVDESASLSSAAVRAEKEALKEIVGSSEISDRGIRVGVLPFSSGAKSPRVIPECSLSEITHETENESNLMLCADQVTRQRQRGTADTDFAAAISAALDTFDRSDATKVILLLTDGKYDPDGNESISGTEQDELDSVLARANQEKVSMWALGFGKADKSALTKYVEATALGDPSCAAKPDATIAAQIQLSTEIRRIIDHATCTGRVTGPVDPVFQFGVSPLLSRVTIEVSSEKGRVQTDEVSVTNALGTEVCSDADLDMRGRWTCSETVSGQDGGTWKVESKSGKKLLALVTWNGSIDVIADGCVVEADQKPVTAVVLSRSDGGRVNFDIEGKVNWPQVVVEITTESGSQLRKADMILDQARNDIAGAAEFPFGAHVDVKMNTEIPENQRLLVRAHQISSCSIVPKTESTTTATAVPVTNLVTPTSAATPDGGEVKKSNGTLVWPLILLLLVVVGGAGAIVVRSRRSRFPQGAELSSRNRHNPNVFDTVETIGGRSKIFFDAFVNSLGASEVTIFQNKSEARYILSRNDDESLAITSLYVHPEDGETEVDQEPNSPSAETLIVLNDEVFNPREADPIDADGRQDQIFLKVIWPVSDEDFFQEDE